MERKRNQFTFNPNYWKAPKMRILFSVLIFQGDFNRNFKKETVIPTNFL